MARAQFAQTCIGELRQTLRAFVPISSNPYVLSLQNVNSYRDVASPAPPSSQPGPTPDSPSPSHPPSSSPGLSSGRFSPTRFAHPELSPGFKTIYKPRTGGLTFAHLLDTLSATFPEMRFRFTSPHPKDFPDDLIALLRDRPNVCRAIHLPAQSGSSRLERLPTAFLTCLPTAFILYHLLIVCRALNLFGPGLLPGRALLQPLVIACGPTPLFWIASCLATAYLLTGFFCGGRFSHI